MLFGYEYTYLKTFVPPKTMAVISLVVVNPVLTVGVVVYIRSNKYIYYLLQIGEFSLNLSATKQDQNQPLSTIK